MKKVLSLILAFVFVVGICASAPITITANAASVDDLIFTLNEDGESYSVTDCWEYASGEIIIPSKYKGKPVTRVGDSAFEECTSITSVVVPQSVTVIDYWAFYGCTSLEEISLPDTLTYIGSCAFTDTAYYNGSHWTGGTTLYIGNHLIECYSYNGYCEIREGIICIADDAFQECENVTGIYIPNTVTSIGDGAFSSCTSLEYIDIPDSVVNMPLGAFSGCKSLIEVTIPVGVKALGYEESLEDVSIYGCESLEAIYVDSANPNYTSVDGVLFNKNKTALLYYPEGKSDTSYVVPTGTEKIVSVENNTYLKEVTISETVKEIEAYAFRDCTRLGKITILGNLEKVGNAPFMGTAYSYNPSNWENHCMYIGDWAVAIEEDCEGDITIKDGTKYLAVNLFGWCHTVENIYIPASVINVDEAFGGYTSFKSVNVAKDNPYFSTVDGVLFDKAKKELIFCPGGKKTSVYTVPTGVEVIGDRAFYCCESIGKIILPSTLKTIGDHSFYMGTFSEIEIPTGVTRIERGAFFLCENLTKITLPNTLQYIGVAIFDCCDNLKTVVFKGTEDEFNNIEIDETNNEKLESVEIVFEPSVHTHSYTSTITKNPTCTETGVKTFTCTTCGYSYTQTISVTGHSYNSGVVTKQPTCTVAGTKTFTCTTCSDSYTESITATGHKWNNGSVTLQPTCTTVGEKTYVCNVCYESKSETISVLGHNYAKDFTIDKNPTYDEAGSKSRHCTRCDAKTSVTSIPKLVRLSAPTITSVTSEQNGVKFTWQKVNGTEGYIIFKLVQNDAGEYVYKQLAVVGASTLAFTDQTAVDGETYCYAVATMDAMGNAGQYSEFAHTYKKLTTLSTPKVSVKSTSSGVKVSWKAIENAESYIVYRRTYNAKTKKWGDWKKLKSGYTKTSFTDKKAKLGTKYRYTVKAVNGSVKSKYKSTDTIKYNVTPTVNVAKVSNGVKVTWSTAATATSYKIYRSEYNTKTKKWSSWKGIKTAKATSKSYTDKSAKKGVKYRYTVRAVNGSYKSTFKASTSVKR